MDGSLRGALLVAGPGLIDPNFARSVVLVCDHSADAALGLILNRPTRAEVGMFLPDWVSAVATPPVVFEGGPVQRETAVALAEVDPWPATVDAMAVVHGAGLIDISAGPAALGEGLRRLRIFSGYAGWGGGQLEGEVAGGDWFVVTAEPTDLFPADAAALWRRVLRRQRGRTALYATFPDDLHTN